MGELVLISSGKGGVGKSTLCKHLGYHLSTQGKRVLIVEVDGGFRTMDLLLGVSHNIVYDIKDILESRCTVETGIISCGQNLFFIPTTMDCDFQPTGENLTALLNYVKQKYDYILIDSGAGYTHWHKMLASIVDMALIVVIPTFPATRAASQLSLQLRKQGLSHQRLVINRIPKQLPTGSIDDLDEVIDLVGLQLIGAISEISHGDHATSSVALEEFQRISRRLQGEYVELALV